MVALSLALFLASTAPSPAAVKTAATADPQRLICKMSVTSSGAPVRVCMTREQYEQARLNTQQTIRETQQRSYTTAPR